MLFFDFDFKKNELAAMNAQFWLKNLFILLLLIFLHYERKRNRSLFIAYPPHPFDFKNKIFWIAQYLSEKYKVKQNKRSIIWFTVFLKILIGLS